MSDKEKASPNKDNGLGERIEKAAQLVGGKRALAEKANIKESQLYRYINGKNVPSVFVMVDIAEAAEIDPGWLSTGIGPMMRTDAEKMRFEPKPKYDMFFDKDLLAATLYFECFSEFIGKDEDRTLSEDEIEQKVAKTIQERSKKIELLYVLIFYGGFYKRGDSFEKIKESVLNFFASKNN